MLQYPVYTLSQRHITCLRMRTIILNGVHFQGRCWSVLFFAWWEPLKVTKFLWYRGRARWKMQLIHGKSTVSTEDNNEIGGMEKEDEQFGCLANFQFSTSAMVFASLTVFLVIEQPKRKVRGLWKLISSWLIFEAYVCVTLYEYPWHPYIEILPTLW